MNGDIDRGMERVLARLEREKKKLSPADFKAFVADLIKTGKAQGGREEVFWFAFEDQYCPPQDWRAEWEKGPWEQDDEAIRWLRARPESLRQLVLRFPPSCIVRAIATTGLRCPAPGTVGIVRHWREPSADRPEGLIGVLSHPEGRIVHDCRPEWLEVVGYYKGLTPDVLGALLMENK